jgi:flagellar hook-associated protein 3 FlgL
MRVTDASLRESYLRVTRAQQQALARTQLQVTSGQRFQRPADDPVAASRALDIERALANNTQYSGNAEIARNRLATSESALAQVGDLLQRLRELAVGTATATASNESRKQSAAEVREQLQQLVQLANTADGNGQYLFAGFSGSSRPFVVTPTGIQYNGDQGQRLLQIGPDRQVADGTPGADIFQLVRDGNGVFSVSAAATNAGTALAESRSITDRSQYDSGTYAINFTAPGTYEVRDGVGALVASGAYVPGQSIAFRGVQVQVTGTPVAGDSFQVAPSRNKDVFSSVQDMITLLENGADSPVAKAAFSNRMNSVLENLDQGLGKVLDARASVGARLSTIDAQVGLNRDLAVELKTTLSSLKDLDYAEALSRMQTQLTSLEAAQKSYVRMQGLSLFDYL